MEHVRGTQQAFAYILTEVSSTTNMTLFKHT